MLTAGVAENVRDADVARFVCAAQCQWQDVIEAGISQRNHPPANTAASAVAFVDRLGGEFLNSGPAFASAIHHAALASVAPVCLGPIAQIGVSVGMVLFNPRLQVPRMLCPPLTGVAPSAEPMCVVAGNQGRSALDTGMLGLHRKVSLSVPSPGRTCPPRRALLLPPVYQARMCGRRWRQCDG